MSTVLFCHSSYCTRYTAIKETFMFGHVESKRPIKRPINYKNINYTKLYLYNNCTKIKK